MRIAEFAQNVSMSTPVRDRLRYTIVDERGVVSFVGDSFYIHPLVAACSSGPRTLVQAGRRRRDRQTHS
jgi:hypothetical protein